MFIQMFKFHLNNQKKNIKDYLKICTILQMHKFKEFPGVLIEDVINLEKFFEVKIILYSLNANGMSEYQSKIYLNVFQNHFSYITNLINLLKSSNVINVEVYSKDFGI